MKTAFLILGLCLVADTAPGMATFELGSDQERGRQTVAQADWPHGLVELPRHRSRVYSFWVNGGESFYFNAKPGEVQTLIDLFAAMRIREFVITFEDSQPVATTFKDKQVPYNARLGVTAGIVRAVQIMEQTVDTLDPTLTICIDPEKDFKWVKNLRIPEHVIVESKIQDLPVASPAKPALRKLWYARVTWDDGKPAAAFESGLAVTVTLWEQNREQGIRLGRVSHNGLFHAPFSVSEIAALRTGGAWLTLTTGNHFVEPKPDDPKLLITQLFAEEGEVVPVAIDKPGFFHGRILFEDGSPAVLDPPPKGGRKIGVTFSFGISQDIDDEGYFEIFFTPEQFKELIAEKARKNVYVPDYSEPGRATALHAFPAGLLGPSKEEAGELRIPRPLPEG